MVQSEKGKRYRPKVMDKILSVHDLACGYRTGFRIEGVSFEVERGAFAGILGPNGTGKSTLFKGLTGDLPLLEGEVVIAGKSLGAYTGRELSRTVAVVSQFTEEAAVTAWEYVMMGRLPYRKHFQFFDTAEDSAIVTGYMELTGTLPLKDRLMPELSGGEQQMVAIASALAQEPKLLLLDEPTSHLDLTRQIRFLDLLKRLNRETGISILAILHDLNLASAYCDYLLLTDKGHLVAKGNPEEVLERTRLEEIYGLDVAIERNPVTGSPLVLPIPRTDTGSKYAKV